MLLRSQPRKTHKSKPQGRQQNWKREGLVLNHNSSRQKKEGRTIPNRQTSGKIPEIAYVNFVETVNEKVSIL